MTNKNDDWEEIFDEKEKKPAKDDLENAIDESSEVKKPTTSAPTQITVKSVHAMGVDRSGLMQSEEEVEKVEDLIEREKFWINYYHSINPNLLNIQSIEEPLKNVRTEEDEANFNYLVRIIYDIPNILKKERLYRNLTQSKLADEMGVNRSTISLS